jgi:hypothetical protein
MNRISTISKMENLSNVSNVSNEAVQNIASVYSDISGTVAFNNAIITGTLNNNNNTQIGSTLDVSGNTHLGANLTVTGNAQINSLNVSGITKLASDLDVSGNINLSNSRIYTGSGGIGFRSFNIALNKFQQGDMQIKDAKGNTYAIDAWVLIGPMMSVMGVFIVSIYPNSNDKTWHINVQMPPNQNWLENSVTVTAIPINYFDASQSTF